IKYQEGEDVAYAERTLPRPEEPKKAGKPKQVAPSKPAPKIKEVDFEDDPFASEETVILKEHAPSSLKKVEQKKAEGIAITKDKERTEIPVSGADLPDVKNQEDETRKKLARE